MTDPIITTTDLTRLFGDTVAVNRLSLDVQPGEIFGFLGHNGSKAPRQWAIRSPG